MSDGLNIRKISPPIFGASRVKATKRESPDSRKKQFQGHFEDEKENKSEDGLPPDTQKLQQESGSRNNKNGAGGTNVPQPLRKNLGKRIDIHV